MAKKLSTEDIVEKGLFKEPIEETREFLKVVKELQKEVKDLGDELQKSVGKKSPLSNSDEVESFRKEMEQLKVVTDELKKLETQEAKLKARLIDLTKQEALEKAKLRVEIQERNKALKEEAKEQLGLLSTYQKQSKRLNELRKKYKNLVLEQGKNAEGAKELRKEIQKLDKTLKDVDAEVGQFQRSVGNYEKVNQGAKKSFGSLSGFLLGTVVGAFTKSRDESRNFNVVLEQVKSTVKLFAFAVKDFIADIALPTIQNFFISLKKQSLEAKLFFADLLPDALQSEKTKKKVADLETQIADLTATIVANNENLENAVNPFDNFLDKVGDVNDSVKELLLAIDANIDVVSRLELEIAKLAKKEEELQAIADDTTKSFEEREASIKAAQGLSIERAEKEIEIAERNLDIAVQKAKLDFEEKERLELFNEEQIKTLEFLKSKKAADVIGLENLEELKNATIALTEAEKEKALTEIDNNKTIAELKQDRLERDLDILIDGFDNQKTINERIIADEKRTLEERQALLDDTIKRGNNSFTRQTEILEELSKAGINYEELLDLDAEALNERIRSLEQSEIIEGRTLEVIRERRLVLQDLEEAQEELNELKRQEVLQETELNALRAGKTGEQVDKAVREARKKQLKKQIEDRKAADQETLELELELARLEVEIEEEKQEKLRALREQATAFVQEQLKKQTEARVNALNEEIEASKERESQLRDAAQQGNLLAEESIALEKERQDKLTAEREEAVKRQRIFELSLAAISAYANKSQSGDDNALTSTITDITTLLSFANNLQAFEKGGLVEGGEQLVRINERGQEYVISHGAVNKYGTDMLDKINTGEFAQMEVTRSSGGSSSDFNYMMNQALDKVSKEFKTAVSNIPQQRWSMSEITGGLKEEIEKSNQLKSRHYRKGKRLN